LSSTRRLPSPAIPTAARDLDLPDESIRGQVTLEAYFRGLVGRG
jgi:hypothetical protein